MPSHYNKGGRMPASERGRPPQAKGVGKNAKRHDLERPATPGLHGSDLQKGDVQAMEQGQRIAPARTQQSATPAPPRSSGGGPAQSNVNRSVEVPDPIDFLGSRQGQEFGPPQLTRQIDESKALTWLPILRRLAAGPGASPKLVSAFINQARKMQQSGGQPATIIDSYATDDGIEAMLAEGMFPDSEV